MNNNNTNQKLPSLPSYDQSNNEDSFNDDVVKKSIYNDKTSSSLKGIKKVQDQATKLWNLLDAVSVELHGRYSDNRLDELESFLTTAQESTTNAVKTTFRTFAAAIAIPLLAISVLYVVNAVIPLNNPYDGILLNESFLNRSTLEVFIACSEIVIMLNAQLPDLNLGFFGTVTPALVYASVHHIQLGLLPYVFQSLAGSLKPWFPFPYTIHMTAPICWVFTAVALVAFIRNPLVTRYQTYSRIPKAWPRLLNYIVLEAAQFGIIMIYTAYGVLYKYAGKSYPQLLTLLLIAMKFGGKMVISNFSERYTSDTSPMLVVFTAELFNAIYTCFVLQSSSSNYTVIGMLVLVDVGQNGVYWYNFHKYRQHPDLMPKTKSVDSLAKIRVRPSVAVLEENLPQETTLPTKVKLRFYSTSEHLVLTEYVEFITPVIYAAFLTVMYSSGNKEYFTGLRSSEFSEEDFKSAITSLAVLASLEALSFIILFVILKRMVNINAFYHLGFVLNKHFMLAVVTLTMWLIVTTAFNLDHNGCDFTFIFAWIK